MALRRQSRQTGRQARLSPTPKKEFFSYHASRQTLDASSRHSVTRQSPVADRPTRTATSGGGTVRKFTSKERLPAVLALVVLVASALYMTTLSANAKVVIDGPGDDFKVLRPVATYQDAANDLLGGSILNKSKLTLNTTGLQTELQKKFPELSDVSVVLPLTGHRPIVQAISEKPALLLASKQGVFVVGSSGRVLMKATDLNGGLPDIPNVRDEAELSIEPGKGGLAEQDVTFITTLHQQFKAKDIEVSSMTLPTLASELHVRITGQPYYIKFNLQSDARIAAGQYFALKKKLESDKITPAEYVDSRVEERIYYK